MGLRNSGDAFSYNRFQDLPKRIQKRDRSIGLNESVVRLVRILDCNSVSLAKAEWVIPLLCAGAKQKDQRGQYRLDQKLEYYIRYSVKARSRVRLTTLDCCLYLLACDKRLRFCDSGRVAKRCRVAEVCRGCIGEESVRKKRRLFVECGRSDCCAVRKRVRQIGHLGNVSR